MADNINLVIPEDAKGGGNINLVFPGEKTAKGPNAKPPLQSVLPKYAVEQWKKEGEMYKTAWDEAIKTQSKYDPAMIVEGMVAPAWKDLSDKISERHPTLRAVIRSIGEMPALLSPTMYSDFVKKLFEDPVGTAKQFPRMLKESPVPTAFGIAGALHGGVSLAKYAAGGFRAPSGVPPVEPVRAPIAELKRLSAAPLEMGPVPEPPVARQPLALPPPRDILGMPTETRLLPRGVFEMPPSTSEFARAYGEPYGPPREPPPAVTPLARRIAPTSIDLPASTEALREATLGPKFGPPALGVSGKKIYHKPSLSTGKNMKDVFLSDDPYSEQPIPDAPMINSDNIRMNASFFDRLNRKFGKGKEFVV